MARRPSIKTKIQRRQGRGEGTGYKPFYTVNEANSLGTAVAIRDWKTGRSVQCLSQGEAIWYYILRWDDNNVDIREQFPLVDEDFSNKDTVRIAKELGFRHPGGEAGIMATDFLVTEAGGGYHAYSVKQNRKLDERALQKLCIEKLYWESRGVKFTLLFKEDADRTLAGNIRLAVEFYDASLVRTPEEAVKHMVATKRFAADLTRGVLDAETLRKILIENTKEELSHGRCIDLSR